MFDFLLAQIQVANKMIIERFSLTKKSKHFIFGFSQIFCWLLSKID